MPPEEPPRGNPPPHPFVAQKHCDQCRAIYQRVYRLQRMRMPDAIKVFERLLGRLTEGDRKQASQAELEAGLGSALEG